MDTQSLATNHAFMAQAAAAVEQCVQQPSNRDSIQQVLDTIVQIFPGSAHVKKGDQCKYCCANKKILDFYNMSSNELIGKDVYSVSEKMRGRWPADYEDEVACLDKKIISSMQPVVAKAEAPFLNVDGQVVQHSLSKIPIKDPLQGTTLLLTLAIDITPLRDKVALRNLYKTFFKNKRVAREKFLIHIGLQKFTASNIRCHSITERELDCLVLLARGLRIKEIAARLNISPRTVETYLDNIRTKCGYSSTTDMRRDFAQHYYDLEI